MNPLYASYVIHLIAEAASTDNEFARIAIYDEILDALTDTPAVYGCVLSEAVWPIEDYLSLRPERYEQIAQFAREGRLEFGPWYVFQAMDSLEMSIRNLQMGAQTLKHLGVPLSTAMLPPDFSPQMPQILRGFGIQTAFMEKTPGGRAAEVLTGLDGSTLTVIQAPFVETIDWDHARATTPGRHLMARVTGSPKDWLNTLESLRSQPDEPFLSSRASLASVIQLDPISDAPKAESVPGIGSSSATLLQKLEPAIVRAEYEGSAPLKSPQRIVQAAWRDCLRTQSESAAGDVARVEALSDLYGEGDDLFSVESDGFQISAVKLRDDGQPGVILRGCNPTGEAHPVRLRAWRDFTQCAVVRLDESRTGAGLPITNGDIQFTSNPHRITTLWFYDG